MSGIKDAMYMAANGCSERGEMIRNAFRKAIAMLTPNWGMKEDHRLERD